MAWRILIATVGLAAVTFFGVDMLTGDPAPSKVETISLDVPDEAGQDDQDRKGPRPDDGGDKKTNDDKDKDKDKDKDRTSKDKAGDSGGGTSGGSTGGSTGGGGDDDDDGPGDDDGDDDDDDGPGDD